MGADSAEQRIKEQIFAESLDRIESTVDEGNEKDDIENPLWEGLSRELDVENAGSSIKLEHIVSNGKINESVKPVNYKFNIFGFVGAVGNSALAIGSAVAMPVLVPACLISVLISLKQSLTVDLEIEDTIVYYSIYTGNDTEPISKSDLKTQVNSTIEELDFRVDISDDQIRSSIDKLVRIGSIDIVSENLDEEHYKPLESCTIELPK